MTPNLGFRSLRWRLTGLIGLLLVLAVGVTFYAIFRGTGSELRAQIDRDLHEDAIAFAHAVPTNAPPAAIEAAARKYLAAQPFSPSSRILSLRVGERRPVTNEPDLLSLDPQPGEPVGEQYQDARQAKALLTARHGYSEVRVADVGEVRIFVRTLPGGMTIVVGEPTAPVERAQHGVVRTFLLAGSITLVLALLAGYLVAVRATRPLARMARIAHQVDAGDLSPRMSEAGPRDEIRVLAESFDHMLDRLEDAFARQRGFASDASHELRTPLTVIRGQIEVLARQSSPTDEEVRRVERLVLTEAARMERLVDDLLLLARADEREFHHTRSFDLTAFVGELFDGTSATADRRFALSAVPEGTLDADPDRVAQALRNLLRNAIEHTAPGGLVRLEVTARGERVSFAVEDDGPGIPAEQRSRVFDRFHRTDASRTRSRGGSGLGLAIVLAIVEAHGGSASVGNSPEGGARVAFELPRFTPRPPDAAPPQRAGAAEPLRPRG